MRDAQLAKLKPDTKKNALIAARAALGETLKDLSMREITII